MPDANALPHLVEQTLDIDAERETVFRFFTDPARWASWWGPGSTIDPRAGGAVLICYPGGVQVSGEVVDIVAPERLVFTYGYASGTPIPPGSSLVTIRLEPAGAATRLRLSHAFAEPEVRDQHAQGWRYQLSLFANAVADDLHAGAADLVHAWYRAWSAEPEAIEAGMRTIATPSVRLRDRFSAIEGLDALVQHVSAARRFMPGLSIHPDGDVRHCQGMVLSDWVARMPDGTGKFRGTNVFLLAPDRRIASVTGFWR